MGMDVRGGVYTLLGGSINHGMSWHILLPATLDDAEGGFGWIQHYPT